jgi:hypothetical protein
MIVFGLVKDPQSSNFRLAGWCQCIVVILVPVPGTYHIHSNGTIMLVHRRSSQMEHYVFGWVKDPMQRWIHTSLDGTSNPVYEN